MDDREMMRDASTFEEDIMHGATASNLLLEAEPGPANLPDKSNHMEYDDFGDGSMGNTDGGMLGEHVFIDSNCTLYGTTVIAFLWEIYSREIKNDGQFKWLVIFFFSW